MIGPPDAGRSFALKSCELGAFDAAYAAMLRDFKLVAEMAAVLKDVGGFLSLMCR
jgi:hypothetical protein